MTKAVKTYVTVRLPSTMAAQARGLAYYWGLTLIGVTWLVIDVEELGGAWLRATLILIALMGVVLQWHLATTISREFERPVSVQPIDIPEKRGE